jgi:hypothetical protein
MTDFWCRCIQKTAHVIILLFDKIVFKLKLLVRGKVGHYLIVIRQINQEDISICVCVCIDR